MCGIAGIVNTTKRDAPALETLRTMISAIRHRGPDEFGAYRDSRAGLAHARLAILDPVSGQQPMTNEDGSLWIVFNGEIFNFVELRKDLEKQGHVFRTRSDTEVILHAYESWGTSCLNKFNGQWAFAIWDSRKGRLILARDRVGICPLYVSQENGQVRFSSEIKAILADPSIDRAIDPRGLDQIFTYWSCLAPVTMFRGVEEIPAGSFRTYTVDGVQENHLFWEPSFEPAKTRVTPVTASLHENAEILLAKLTYATKLRMLRADVPVGSYLSGGLDSTLTAYLAKTAAHGEFRTFSLRFEDSEFDETDFQRIAVSHLESTHEEIVVRRSDIAESFPSVIHHTEQPILRTAPAPLFLLSRMVRKKGIKAVLTGEGADEMLAGYDIFREAKIREFWARQPESVIRPLLFERIYPYLKRSPQLAKRLSLEFWRKGLQHAGQPGFSHEPRWTTTSGLKKFLSTDIIRSLEKETVPGALDQLPESFPQWDSLSQAQYLEIKTLLTGYLLSSQGDRMLMAHSVEGRFPFLDADVMDFCQALPAFHRLALLDEKAILKNSSKGIVPDEIRTRKKQPYRAPDAEAFLGKVMPDYVGALFSPETVKRSGLFDEGKVSLFMKKMMSEGSSDKSTLPFSNTDNMTFVGLLSTLLLWSQFVDGRPSERPDEVTFNTLIDRTVDPRKLQKDSSD